MALSCMRAILEAEERAYARGEATGHTEQVMDQWRAGWLAGYYEGARHANEEIAALQREAVTVAKRSAGALPADQSERAWQESVRAARARHQANARPWPEVGP